LLFSFRTSKIVTSARADTVIKANADDMHFLLPDHRFVKAELQMGE